MSFEKQDYASFRRIVWHYGKIQGRNNLPWRKTRNPYRVLVSEVMLQQTQVSRVVPLYRTFLKKFPSLRALARAELAEVLTAWQGLGYNRRAKMLLEAAQILVAERHGGVVPRDPSLLETLPGIGRYSARAVSVFAFNEEYVFVETNVRTAVLHHFFPRRRVVQDKEIEALLLCMLPKNRAREWYGALMDYGAYLKRRGVHLNKQSAHYHTQKSFTGSPRQARGALLRALTDGLPHRASTLTALLGAPRRAQMRAALAALLAEGLIEKKGMYYFLPN